MDRHRVHTAAGVSHSHSVAQAMGCDSSGPVDRRDRHSINHEVVNSRSKAQSAANFESSGLVDRINSINHEVEDLHSATQDAVGSDSCRPVDRIDISPAYHKVDGVHSAAQGAQLGSDSSGSGEREDTGYVHTDINDAYGAAQDILGCNPSRPDSSDSAQGAQKSSGPENSGDSNYIHTEINDSYGAVQDALGY